MLSIHTNNASLTAQNSIARTEKQFSTSMTRLSTGYRINSAMDDAAGLQIASRLKAQASGMAVAMRNTQNSTSMLQTAEGALEEMTTMLVRMKDLATQAADASATLADKAAMQAEYDGLVRETTNVEFNTTFGGEPLLATGLVFSQMTFQIGASASETMVVDLSSQAGAMVVDVAMATSDWMWFGSQVTAHANEMIGRLEKALGSVGTLRSSLGATANRLEHVYNNLANISANSKAATGIIMDVDFATESANMTSKQMLLQAGTAMLKQTNSMSSMIASLLQ
jgi:flagellin